MSDLPVCKLCQQPHVTIGDRDSIYHTSFDEKGYLSTCPMSSAEGMTEEQWIKLMAPATADESCDGCLNLKGEKKCFNCVRSAYVMDNYEAAKAGENVT